MVMPSLPKNLWLVMFLLASSLAQGAGLKILSRWDGEDPGISGGAFFLKPVFEGFKEAGIEPVSLNVLMYDPKFKRKYFFQYQVKPTDDTSQVWLLRKGRYSVFAVQVRDRNGQRWNFKPKGINLHIYPDTLASWGIWKISKDGLRVEVSSQNIKFKPPVRFFVHEFTKTVDGLTGNVFATLRNAPGISGNNRNMNETVLGTQKLLLHIGFYYVVESVGPYTDHGIVEAVLGKNDGDLRSCYSDYLNLEGKDRGEVIFTFLASKNTKAMKTLSLKKATIGDNKLQRCLYYKILALDLPVNKNLLGRIKFTMDHFYRTVP